MNKYVLVLVLLFSANNSVLPISQEVEELLRQYLPMDSVIIEAGAHNGRDTVQMAKIWPKATIYAFEPHPKYFQILKNSIFDFDNVHCFEIALSNVVGRAKFYISDEELHSGSSSLLLPRLEILNRYWPAMRFADKDRVFVNTVTLDVWAKENQVKNIDFMWLDMQGAELMILKASPQIMKTVKFIYTEVSFIGGYESSPFYSEVCEWFKDQGFHVAWERSFHYGAEGDVFFVREEA